MLDPYTELLKLIIYMLPQNTEKIQEKVEILTKITKNKSFLNLYHTIGK